MILARGKNDEGGRHQTPLSSQDDRSHLRKAYRKLVSDRAIPEGTLAVEKGGEGFFLDLRRSNRVPVLLRGKARSLLV